MTSSYSTTTLLSSCQNRKTKAFDAKCFVAQAETIAVRTASQHRCTPTSATSNEHVVSVCRVKDVLLGRAKLQKCPCCSAFRMVRAGATCKEIQVFDCLLHRLQGHRCGDNCHPGDDELPMSAIRVVGSQLHVSMDASGASIAWRLRKLAEQLGDDDDDCMTCRLVLKLKCVLLLMILASTAAGPIAGPRQR